MRVCAIAALTCWCCALVAIPRPSPWGDAADERRIVRVLGRRVRIVALALLLTAAAIAPLVGALSGVAPDLVEARSRHRLCTHPSVGFPTCYRWVSTGAWMREELGTDGTWIAVGIVALAEPYGNEPSDAILPLRAPYVEDPRPDRLR